MTEAAHREPVSRPARRMRVSAAALWTGMALGTFLAAVALTHGVMLPVLRIGFLDAIFTFVLLIAAAVVLAEVLKRHHRSPGLGARRRLRQARRVCGLQGRPQARRPGCRLRRGPRESTVDGLAGDAGRARRVGPAALAGMGRTPRSPAATRSASQLNRRYRNHDR